MEDDLSLSQTLGGLRIANNPDDSPPQTALQHSVINVDSNRNIESTQGRGNIHMRLQHEAENGDTRHVNNSHLRSGSSYGNSRRMEGQSPQTLDPSIHGRIYGSNGQEQLGGSSTSLDTQSDDGRLQRIATASSSNTERGVGVSRNPQEPFSQPMAYRQSEGDRGNIGSHDRQSVILRGQQETEGEVRLREVDAQRHPPGPPRQESTDSMQRSKLIKKGVKDFNFGRTLGEGSYSTVLAATDRQTLTEYAIKMLDKRHIIKEKKVKYVNIERNTLNRLCDHPGIVRLYYTFQDDRSLYFVLDLAAGGELLGYVKKMGSFDEECTRYYTAQILDAIEYMHSRGVIHRDLKPENVLLDDQMRVKITDFGTAKLLDLPTIDTNIKDGNEYPYVDKSIESNENSRANSFVGTAEYVSPELLTDKSAFKSSDLWAFGCILFQLLSGRPPFKAGNEYQTFQKIVNLDYTFPSGFPPVAKDLVQRLLVLDPTKRITIEHIKSHQFFDGVAWGKRLWKQKAPRLKAYVAPPQESKIIKLDRQTNMFIHDTTDGQQPASAITQPIPVNRTASSKVITELSPPTQLDLEWSSLLVKPNERILKLGNLVVTSTPATSPHIHDHNASGTYAEPPKKLSRFFQGSQTKKRQRLVMITSGARLIIAGLGAVGGDLSKIKGEIDLQGLGVVVRQTVSSTSGAGGSFTVDTREKGFIFEDAKTSTQGWVDAVNRARDLAAANFVHDESNGMSDTTTNGGLMRGEEDAKSSLNTAMPKHTKPLDSGEERVTKRFSRRHSKNGLAAVF